MMLRKQRLKKFFLTQEKIDRVKKDHEFQLERHQGGRYLRVIYVPDPEPNSAFVITAYELRGKPLIAYRRRRRRKKK
jgi:hypothetical protein